MAYQSRIPEIILEMETALDRVVNQAGYRFEREAKSRAPAPPTPAGQEYRRTGYLRGQIRWEPTGSMEGEVIGGADYTHFVEYGTRYQGAQPMFAPAAELVKSMFAVECSQALRKVVE